MALASDVITGARDRMLGFDLTFLSNTELLLRLSEKVETIVDRLIRLDRMSKDLPGDTNDTVDVSTYAASYALPASCWRIRQVRVNYSAGSPLPAFIVPSNWRHNVPERHPSLYIQAQSIFPIDGATSLATRIYGWTDADAVEFDFVTKPAALTDVGDTIEAPDEAIPYLRRDLAIFMGIRGKVADQTMRDLKEELREEERLLLTLWEGGDAA